MGISKFESYVVSHPVRSLGVLVTMSLSSPPLAGFLRKAESLCVLNLIFFGPLRRKSLRIFDIVPDFWRNEPETGFGHTA